MGSFGHRDFTLTATSGVIDPKDFQSNLHPNKHNHLRESHWNAGPLRHVVAALAGTPVIIVAERRTGFTLMGAVLVDVRGRGMTGHGVAISTESCKTSQNPQGITVYDVRQIGIIIPLQDTTHGVGHLAVQSERRELELARRIYVDSLPQDRPAGSVEVTSHSNEVHAGYRRDSYADRGPTPNWMRITLRQVQEQSLCTDCLKTRDTEMHQYNCEQFELEMQARMAASKG